MIISAFDLDYYQSCRRKHVFNAEWNVRRPRPKSLFDRCLRQAIVELGGLADPYITATRAKAAFLEAAASPGMDIGPDASPYVIAKDYTAMLSTIIHAISRSPLLTTFPLTPRRVAEGIDWRFASRADDSGGLHRWVTVDSWTTDDLARELHAWRTIGDIAVADCPLTLHVIVIGRMREGRRASPWARGFINPEWPNFKMHFVTKTGKPLTGKWKPKYLADDKTWNADQWVDQMFAENVARRLLFDVPVKQPAAAVIADTKSQIIAEAAAMAVLAESGARWMDVPMSRAACDSPFAPCPYQWICYGGDERVDIGGIGLYDARDIKKAATAAPQAVPA